MNMFEEIAEKYGQEYILRQLAEECAELTQASLKLIRANRKETPMRPDEAIEHFLEEMADVKVMMMGVEQCMLNIDQKECIADIQDQKMGRMNERMLKGNMEEYVW